MRKLELLNSEGPILVASRSKFFSNSEAAFILTFKGVYRSYVMTEEELRQFLDGEIEIYNGEDKLINFTNMPDGMKPDKETIQKFLS